MLSSLQRLQFLSHLGEFAAITFGKDEVLPRANGPIVSSGTVVPRIFPTYSPNPKGKKFNYSLYCKFQLLRFKPWITNPINAWNGQQQSDKKYKDAWHDFLNTDYAKSHVLNWIYNLQNVIESNQETISEHDEQQENELEEWMILSNLNKPFESEEYSKTDIEWHLDRQNYSQQQIGEMTTWIQKNKQQFDGISNEQCDGGGVLDISLGGEVAARPLIP